MNESGDWINDTSGLPATNEDIASVLQSVDRLRIRGDWQISGSDIGELDNVVLASAETIGDLNGDGSVGVPDLLLLLAAWGNCGDCEDCAADLDGNCTVGVPDLLELLANWG